MKRPTLSVLRRTDNWIAIAKPAGLAVIPGRGEDDSVLEALGRDLNIPSSGTVDPRVRVCHRLDKETTGILLFALNTATQRHISQQFQNNTVEKQYLALVAGRLGTEQGEVATQIGPHPTSRLKMAVVKHGGRSAITHFRVEQRFRDFTLVRCFPKTGKTHQIRVHMAHLGHPLAIDPLYYPGRNSEGLYLSRFKRDYRPTRGDEERPLISRLPLHAERLSFDDVDGGRIELNAEPPKDFRAIINMLGRHGR